MIAGRWPRASRRAGRAEGSSHAGAAARQRRGLRNSGTSRDGNMTELAADLYRVSVRTTSVTRSRSGAAVAIRDATRVVVACAVIRRRRARLERGQAASPTSRRSGVVPLRRPSVEQGGRSVRVRRSARPLGRAVACARPTRERARPPAPRTRAAATRRSRAGVVERDRSKLVPKDPRLAAFPPADEVQCALVTGPHTVLE